MLEETRSIGRLKAATKGSKGHREASSEEERDLKPTMRKSLTSSASASVYAISKKGEKKQKRKGKLHRGDDEDVVEELNPDEW